MTEFKTFTGTPSELGAELFVVGIIPVLQQASAHMTPEQMTQMYGGLIGAMFGAMAADFGQPTALQVVQVMAASFAKYQPLQETH